MAWNGSVKQDAKRRKAAKHRMTQDIPYQHTLGDRIRARRAERLQHIDNARQSAQDWARDYTDTAKQWLQDYADNAKAAVITYVNNKITEAQTQARTYVDNKDAALSLRIDNLIAHNNLTP